MSSADSHVLRCCYCEQIIADSDDAQRIARKTYAHTACAFKVNDEFFSALDAEEKDDDDAE